MQYIVCNKAINYYKFVIIDMKWKKTIQNILY